MDDAPTIPLKSNVTRIYGLLRKARGLASKHDEGYKLILDEVYRISDSLDLPIGNAVYNEIHKKYEGSRN